ncbi:MAG: hypothetical protein ACREOD_03390 [Candidatus Dormibacteria bacterium]
MPFCVATSLLLVDSWLWPEVLAAGPVTGLRQLQGGNIPDYVTWLTVGLPAFGVTAALAVR